MLLRQHGTIGPQSFSLSAVCYPLRETGSKTLRNTHNITAMLPYRLNWVTITIRSIQI